MRNHKLKKELISEGSGEQEARELLKLARKLNQANKPTVSIQTRLKIEEIAGPPSRAPLFIRYSLGSGLAILAMVVLAAQYSSPSSALYGIKRATEDIHAFIIPEYKDDLVNVRKDELEALDKLEASPDLLEKAAESYKKAVDKSSKRDKYEQDAKKWFDKVQEYRKRHEERLRTYENDSLESDKNSEREYNPWDSLDEWRWRD